LFAFALRFGNGLAEDGDAAIWADGGAQGAAGAFMLGVKQHDGAVTFAVEGIGHGDYIGGTRFAAKFTPFATLNID
jgi:hypothetical protein